ncbi:MAG: hypothetical protein JRE58_07570 [Deltaproteobacteria bacterium]|nr:hypothetical protein [Deltaproteobacteria bacterium]
MSNPSDHILKSCARPIPTGKYFPNFFIFLRIAFYHFADRIHLKKLSECLLASVSRIRKNSGPSASIMDRLPKMAVPFKPGYR